jgi:hypothetical protein
MSKSAALETQVLQFILQGSLPAWDMDAAFYLALHTAPPGEGGTQSSAEAVYHGYARVALPRDGSGFAIAGPQAVNAGLISFPRCTGGGLTATHWSLGRQASGPGQILYHGPLSASLRVQAELTPQFAAGRLTITED